MTIIATTCPTTPVVAIIEEPEALGDLEEVVLLMRVEFWNTLMLLISKYASLYADGGPITQSL